MKHKLFSPCSGLNSLNSNTEGLKCSTNKTYPLYFTVKYKNLKAEHWKLIKNYPKCQDLMVTMVMGNGEPESLGFRHFLPVFVPWRQDNSCHAASHACEVPYSSYNPWQCQELLQDWFDSADLSRKNINKAAQCSGRSYKTTRFNLIPISAASVLEGTLYVRKSNWFSDLPVITCLFFVLEHLW